MSPTHWDCAAIATLLKSIFDWVSEHGSEIAVFVAVLVVVATIVLGPEALATWISIAGLVAGVWALFNGFQAGNWPAVAVDIGTLLVGGGALKLLLDAGKFLDAAHKLATLYRATQTEKFGWQSIYSADTGRYLDKLSRVGAWASAVGAAAAWVIGKVTGQEVPALC